MNDLPIELRQGDFVISTDRARLAPAAVLRLLQDTHWGGGMTLEVLV